MVGSERVAARYPPEFTKVHCTAMNQMICPCEFSDRRLGLLPIQTLLSFTMSLIAIRDL